MTRQEKAVSGLGGSFFVGGCLDERQNEAVHEGYCLS
jgi:hypothetical protein